MPEQNHIIYPGTNIGNMLGPVKHQTWEDSFKLAIDFKHKIYGGNRRAVGGRTDGSKPDDAGDVIDEEMDVDEAMIADADDEDHPKFMLPPVMPGRGKQRLKIACEPFAWHLMPPEFYREIQSSFFAQAVIDLAPGAGMFAEHCLIEGIPYVGITMKEGKDGADHKTVLHEELVKTYLKHMAEEGSPLYNARYATHVSGSVEAKGTPATGGQAAKGKKQKKQPPIEIVAEDDDHEKDEDEENEDLEPPPKRANTTSLATLLGQCG